MQFHRSICIYNLENYEMNIDSDSQPIETSDLLYCVQKSMKHAMQSLSEKETYKTYKLLSVLLQQSTFILLRSLI